MGPTSRSRHGSHRGEWLWLWLRGHVGFPAETNCSHGVWTCARVSWVRLQAVVAGGVVKSALGFNMWVSVFVGVVVYAVMSGHPVATRYATAFSQWLNRTAGLQLAPSQAALGCLGLIIVGLSFVIHGGSLGLGGFGGGYGSGGGYGYGGGGGFSFFWMISAVMLGSTAYRMGGGGQPGGWSVGNLWHSLSNMNIWEGMMLLNLLQRVLGGGGGRGFGGGGFGRRRMF
jgi:hypothetical protein